MSRFLFALLLVAFGYPTSSFAVEAAPVDYNRDIRPILANSCYACHGPDEKQRKAKLRLDSRVEALSPIEPPELREELKRLLSIQLHDQRAAWDMKADGSYQQRTPKGTDSKKSCQEQLIQLTQERLDRLIESKQGNKKRVRTRRTTTLRREALRPTRISVVPESAPTKSN